LFETNFTVIDMQIVLAYLAVTVAIGMLVNRHVHSAADYLVGGRSAGASLSIASFIGTGLGLVTLMYASLEGFNRGFSYLIVPVLWLVATVILGATGWVIAPLRQLRLTTIPEYFQHRFNRRTRIVAGFICALAGILNMGLFPKMGAIFITYATGLGGAGEDAELTVNIITTILILLVLVYTTLGGMVAVLVTDYMQFVVLSLGLGLGLWFCFTRQDLGWENMVSVWSQQRGEKAFNPLHSDSYGWQYVVWMSILAATAAIAWAPEASRALTTASPKTSQRMFLWGAPGFFARMAIPGVWGIAAFCFISQDAAMTSYFSDSSHALHAMPLMLGKIMPIGILGLLVAGLLAAFMSTHDSYLLAWSAVISQDIVGPLTPRGKLSDRQSILVTRVSVVVIGVFLLVWGVWFELPESVWSYMAVTGTVYLSGAATALIGGMYWRRASSTGALLCLLGGLSALPLLFIEKFQRMAAGISPDLKLDQFTDLQTEALVAVKVWLNQPTICLAVYAVCVVLFVAGSLLFPDKHDVTASEVTL
jgi:SSS family solute:Na+ symporter